MIKYRNKDNCQSNNLDENINSLLPKPNHSNNFLKVRNLLIIIIIINNLLIPIISHKICDATN